MISIQWNTIKYNATSNTLFYMKTTIEMSLLIIVKTLKRFAILSLIILIKRILIKKECIINYDCKKITFSVI